MVSTSETGPWCLLSGGTCGCFPGEQVLGSACATPGPLILDCPSLPGTASGGKGVKVVSLHPLHQPPLGLAVVLVSWQGQGHKKVSGGPEALGD